VRWPLAVGAAAVLAPVVLALAGIDFLDTRNLLPALPPLAIVAAVGFDGWVELAADSRRPGWARSGVWAAVALAAISVLVIVLVAVNPRYQRDDWRGVAHALGRAAGERVVLVDPGSGEIPLQTYMRGLRTLTRPVAVRELDLVVVPANVRGGGIGAPPRLAAGQPLPSGFRLAGATYAPTYTVVRLTAPAPMPVTPAEAAVPWVGSGAFGPLLQRSPG
jgi:4-amino-4-deoxy-L-arabinose transferase-like glycosyltransferase